MLTLMLKGAHVKVGAPSICGIIRARLASKGLVGLGIQLVRSQEIRSDLWRWPRLLDVLVWAQTAETAKALLVVQANG